MVEIYFFFTFLTLNNLNFGTRIGGLGGSRATLRPLWSSEPISGTFSNVLCIKIAISTFLRKDESWKKREEEFDYLNYINTRL